MHCPPPGAAGCTAALIQSRPNASGRTSSTRAPRSSIADAPDGVVSDGASHGDETVAEGEPAEPEALLLEGERPLLVALLLVELRLEVVEQQVPAHARTLPLGHASSRSFSTGAEIA